MEFMADIEAMFHQVHIPKKERTYLWWEDVNLEKLIDYEYVYMCLMRHHSLDVAFTLSK